MTQDELQALCHEWQGVLRLQDWDVKVFVVRKRDLSSGDVMGEISFTLPKKTAVISILDPVDYDPDIAWGQDQEQTLVHELLHLHMAPFDHSEGLEHTAMEWAVDSIAKALVSLKRGESHEVPA